MTIQESINATLFGAWLMALEQGTMGQEEMTALTKTLIRSQNGAILSAGGANFDFSPHMKEYAVKCRDGRLLTVFAPSKTVARRAVGWNNVVRIYE